MVAYSFMKGFAPMIVSGRKPHTLRNGRRRHARVGEFVQLYEGMRTIHCRLIARGLCNRFDGIRLNFGRRSSIVLFDVVETAPGEWKRVGDPRPVDDVGAFAWSDGFDSFHAMARFWWDVHQLRRWDGFLIGWGLMVPAGEAAP